MKTQSLRRNPPAAVAAEQPHRKIRVTPLVQGMAEQLMLSAARRAKMMLHGSLATELAAAFENGAKTLPESHRKFNELMNRANRGDKDAQTELAEIQVYVIDNLVKVNALWGGFFVQGTLGPNDNPMWENVSSVEVPVYLGAQDGGAPRWQNVHRRSTFMVPYYSLTTDEFEYTRMDWYSGNVADRAKAGLDTANAISSELDGRFQLHVKAAIGNFTLTGDKWNRVYVPSKRIVVSNLPTSNLITLAGNSPTTKFRLAALDEILKYTRSWGENAFGDGPLQATAVFLPSSDSTAFLGQVEIDDPENEMNRQIFDFGTVVHYGGQNWTFIADPTLDPADGAAYVRMNKPIGKHWSKPSLNDLIIDDSKQLRKLNLESMLETAVFATITPAQQRVNVLKVIYRTPA